MGNVTAVLEFFDHLNPVSLAAVPVTVGSMTAAVILVGRAFVRLSPARRSDVIKLVAAIRSGRHD